MGAPGTLLPTPSGMRPYLKVTDIDVLVIERPPDGGKARIVHREEVKTCVTDQPIPAKRQLDKGAQAIASATRGGSSIRLRAGAVDVTDQIDLSTVEQSTAVTRGTSGKGFDESLGITADDLKRLVEELVQLEHRSRTVGGRQ